MTDKPEHDYGIYLQITVDDPGDIPVVRMQNAAEWVLARHETAAGTEISIVVTTDDEIQALNQQFRGVNAPTDVLSFPAEPDPVPDDVVLEEDEDADYLGDLVLSLPYIQRQATTEQHNVGDELLLAVIHGTLHLLGYDHDTPTHQDSMWEVQTEALAALGVAISVPRFEFPDSDSENDSPA